MTNREIVGDVWLQWRGPNRGILAGVWWNLVLLLFSLAALPFDRRSILGLNPWIKPIKFEVSVIIFLVTMAWMLSALGRLGKWPRLRRIMAWGFGLTMILENTMIAMQSFRGQRSHMNYSSAFNGMVFAAMGLAIALSTMLVVVLLVLYLTTRTGLPRSLTLGAVLGLVMLLAGSAEGAYMVGSLGAHTVGASDGGPGMPFVNWSTGHGDLRIAHFFAIHALQALLFAGWLMSRLAARAWVQVFATIAFAAIYSGAVWLLFEQAMRGRALLAMF